VSPQTAIIYLIQVSIIIADRRSHLKALELSFKRFLYAKPKPCLRFLPIAASARSVSPQTDTILFIRTQIAKADRHLDIGEIGVIFENFFS